MELRQETCPPRCERWSSAGRSSRASAHASALTVINNVGVACGLQRWLIFTQEVTMSSHIFCPTYLYVTARPPSESVAIRRSWGGRVQASEKIYTHLGHMMNGQGVSLTSAQRAR